MDPGWRFNLGDTPGAEQPRFDDSKWRRLDVPHDWSIEGTPRQDAPGGGRVGFFPSGVGWYRKSFRLPAGSERRSASLEFDGVYMNSDVWINGVHLGKRPYGYASFAYDITRHVVRGVNVVAVRVDNSRQPNSRWYTGSGIYRHVWLTIADPLHVAHWGTYVTTPRADSAGADVVVRTKIENAHPSTRSGVVRVAVVDDDGPRGSAGGFVILARRRPAASSWHSGCPWLRRSCGPSSAPALYTLRTEILDGTRSADVVNTAFGIRTIAYDADRGFLLNGRRVKMLGVNLHHDAGCVRRCGAGTRVGAATRAAQGDGRERHPHLAQSAGPGVPRPL